MLLSQVNINVIFDMCIHRCVAIKIEVQLKKMNIYFSDNVKTVELLIRNGADVNAKDSAKSTPLHQAAWRGDSKVKCFFFFKEFPLWKFCKF